MCLLTWSLHTGLVSILFLLVCNGLSGTSWLVFLQVSVFILCGCGTKTSSGPHTTLLETWNLTILGTEQVSKWFFKSLGSSSKFTFLHFLSSDLSSLLSRRTYSLIHHLKELGELYKRIYSSHHESEAEQRTEAIFISTPKSTSTLINSSSLGGSGNLVFVLLFSCSHLLLALGVALLEQHLLNKAWTRYLCVQLISNSGLVNEQHFECWKRHCVYLLLMLQCLLMQETIKKAQQICLEMYVWQIFPFHVVSRFRPAFRTLYRAETNFPNNHQV